MARPSRYTRHVPWRHRISLVLLIVLTALPASGTVCAMLCDSAAATHGAAHHGSGTDCDDERATTPSPGPAIRGAAGHECSDHGAAILSAVVTTATRGDGSPGPGLLVVLPVHASISDLDDSDAAFEYRSPPGSPPATASPFVLRV